MHHHQIDRLRSSHAKCKDRVKGRVAREPPLVDGGLGAVTAQERAELLHRAPVRQSTRDVRPLARVWTLGEEAAELVERCRQGAEDAVRVLVDERNAAQYFAK